MRDYEVVLIIHPDLEDSAVSEVTEKAKGWITDAGGSVNKVDFWGKRKMTYSIRKQREGQYVVIKAQMPPKFSAQLERNLRFTEPVLRFMISAMES